MALIAGFVVSLVIGIVLIPALGMLPAISINVGSVISSSVYSYIRAAAYFLPMVTVGQILVMQVTLWIFRLVIAVIKAVWEVLPFV